VDRENEIALHREGSGCEHDPRLFFRLSLVWWCGYRVLIYVCIF